MKTDKKMKSTKKILPVMKTLFGTAGKKYPFFFVLEFFRGDIERGYFGAITTSQWISLLLLPIAVILIRGRWQEKHLNTQDRPLNRRELARREKYKAWYDAQEAAARKQEAVTVQEQDSAGE